MKFPIVKLCEKVGMRPQNFYKKRKTRHRQEIDADLIVQVVREERAFQPRLGGRKLYYLLKPKLEEAGIRIGRDRFFEVLKGKGLLVEPLPRSPHTTNSRHDLPVFPNLVKDMLLSAANQAWAADITYIRTDEGFLYLSLITDLFSRKIVGFHASDSLETDGCLKALKQARRNLPANAFPVHHSDRGCQYCSRVYTGKLQRAKLRISMTEKNHCAENALAERVNGILKQEYSLGCCFRTMKQAMLAVKQAVWIYNTRRPHSSLGNKTPEEIHQKVA
jgi:transposase InsO family protein